MCGIAGVIETEGVQPSRDNLERMARIIHHRGPDEGGVYIAGNVGLAHRRLSIIDLSAGQQPMSTEDNEQTVVFNGEIYNFPELRRQLEGAGAVFRTASDTEVLLHLYRLKGLAGLPSLNGMFAFALWDRRLERLLLVRDRFGKKPLYYYHDSERFLFASELKSLLAYGKIDRRLNLRAIDEYLSFGYIGGEESAIAGIRRLPPAHFLTFERGKISSEPYWQYRLTPAESPPSEVEAVERVGELLENAVRRRMISDVPLGAFLSGGIDSSVVVALMSRVAGKSVSTFSVGFTEERYSELDDARLIARHLGTDHHEEVVHPNAWEILDDIVWHCDEPFGDSSAIPTYYVCRSAREHVTVALSGDGGDEVFAGYTRYLDLQRYRRWDAIPFWLRRTLAAPLTTALPFTAPGWNFLYAIGHQRRGDLPIQLGLFPNIKQRICSPWFRREVADFDPFAPIANLLAEAAGQDDVSKFQYVDAMHYLPGDILTKVDRMSMANSLEVRSPLLDHELVEFVATLPLTYKLRDSVTKFILRKYAADLLPQQSLLKKKQGFAIPKDIWFQGALRNQAEEILFDTRTLQRGLFQEQALRKMMRHHATGKRDYSMWIWCLIVLEKWIRLFIEGSWDGERPYKPCFQLRE